jgi:formylmethanofuran dehydrogenase subunit B
MDHIAIPDAKFSVITVRGHVNLTGWNEFGYKKFVDNISK